MSSVLKSIENSKPNTSFYINEDIIWQSNIYDDKGNANAALLPNQGVYMDQPASAVTLTQDSTQTTVNCVATGGWQRSNNHYAYSDTYAVYNAVTLEFTVDPSTTGNNDFMIGFGKSDFNTGSPGDQMFNAYPDAGDGNGDRRYSFWFYTSNYSAGTRFRIVYNGAGNVSRYVNDQLVSSKDFDFNTVFPSSQFRIFAVFNGPDNNITVDLSTTVSTPVPARTYLCRSMGKQYVLNNSTYLKVQNVADKNIFYINTSEKKFASLTL
jgi:hypothetical protein